MKALLGLALIVLLFTGNLRDGTLEDGIYACSDGPGQTVDRNDCPAPQKVENQPPASLKIVNQSGKLTTLWGTDFAKLPRQKMKTKDHLGAMASYEGVTLADLLRAAEVTLGKELKGPGLAHCLLIEAKDGYRVVFSLPEVDPNMTDNVVLVADSKDGKALDAKEGPYRLVVPHDKQFMRWVRQVTQISVRAATEISAQGK